MIKEIIQTPEEAKDLNKSNFSKYFALSPEAYEYKGHLIVLIYNDYGDEIPFVLNNLCEIIFTTNLSTEDACEVCEKFIDDRLTSNVPICYRCNIQSDKVVPILNFNNSFCYDDYKYDNVCPDCIPKYKWAYTKKGFLEKEDPKRLLKLETMKLKDLYR